MDPSRLRGGVPTIGLLGGVALLSGIGMAARQHTRNEAEAARWVEHTHQVIETLLQMSAAMGSAESAIRGYAATHLPALLADAPPALADLTASAHRVRELTHDNLVQQRRLDDLAPLLQRRVELMNLRLAALQGGEDPGLSPEGSRLSATIRSMVATMTAAERALLKTRTELREGEAEHLSLITTVGLLSGIVLIGGAFALVRREMAQGRRTARELSIEHRILDSVIEGTTDAVYVKDLADRFILANSACARVLRRTVDQVLGRSMSELMPGESSSVILQQDREILRTGVSCTLEEVAEVGGVSRIFLTTKGPYRDPEKNIIGIIGISRDITDRRQLEQSRLEEMNLHLKLGELLQACRTMEESYQVIGQLAPRFFREESGAVYLFPASHDHLEVQVTWGKEALPAGHAFAPDDCWALRRGQSHFLGDDGAGMACKHAQRAEPGSTLCVPLLAHGEMLGIFHLPTTGTMSQVVRHRAAVLSEQVAMALANLQLREKLRNQSIRDPLTGLFNRRYTEETLTRELHRAERQQSPLAVLAIDVDNFKRFNDTFGHDAGDQVLREIATKLVENSRGGDVASRMGGEELLVMLPGANLEQARAKAEQLRESIGQLEVKHLGIALGRVTISAGVAAHHRGRKADELLRAADVALYRAKREGRDRVVTDETSGEEPLADLSRSREDAGSIPH